MKDYYMLEIVVLVFYLEIPIFGHLEYQHRTNCLNN